jgi:hypothetical protein
MLTPATFVLSTWLALRSFPGSQGSGIPQAIAARRARNRRDALLSILAGIASVGLVGNYNYFGSNISMVIVTIDWVAVFVCGIAQRESLYHALAENFLKE